jgi:hypothetical protein
MPDDPGVRIHRAALGDEGEVARFQAAFDLDRSTGGVWNGEPAVMFEFALDEE